MSGSACGLPWRSGRWCLRRAWLRGCTCGRSLPGRRRCARARDRAAGTRSAWPQVLVMSCSSRGEVADHLVDAVDADRREMVAQRAEVALGVGEQAVVHVALDHLALDLEAVLRDLEQLVDAREQPRLVAAVEVAEPRAVERDDAERAGLLGRAEQAVAALEQLAQVELQAAAHRADHVGLQVRVDEVLEVGQPVFRRHLEQQVRPAGCPTRSPA